MIDLKELNESQSNAVLSDAHKKVMIAGPGSGKTHTLVRMIEFDSDKIDPSQMVAITFTRFAANELKERLIKRIGNTEIFAGTIHSFCLSILENHTEEIMRMDDFSLYDHDDKKDIVTAIIEEFKYKMTFEQYLSMDHIKANIVADEYEQRMQLYNAIDLDMIIDKTIYLLKQYPNVLDDYKKKIKCIYLDEAQDSNYKQLEIIKLLNTEYIRIIGDPDQSIYEWNNANPEILNEIDTHFEGIEMFKLVENYRSTIEIIDKSNKVIRNNVNRVDKDSIAFKHGVEPQHQTIEDSEHEAMAISKLIKEPYSSNAIICRTNAKAKGLFDYLNLKHPCVLLVSGSSIYKKSHIKHIHNLMNAIMNPSDSISFLRFCTEYDLMTHKIATEILNKMVIENTTFNKNIVPAQIWALYMQVLYLHGESKYMGAYEIYSELINRFGIISFFSEKSRTSKINDLDELRRSIKKWNLKQEFFMESTSLKAYLRYVMLIDIQDSHSKDIDAVKIMTIHGAKGLEFERVFIPSINHNEFPSRQSDNEEEERRLLYVGMTRAKEELYTSSTNTREIRNGIIQRAGESKFIKEIYE